MSKSPYAPEIKPMAKAGNLLAMLAVIVSVSLTGCASEDNLDLQEYIQKIKTSQKGRIDPLPDFKPFETYAYSAGNEKDPFVPWSVVNDASKAERSVSNGIQPDMDRRREILEQFPLDSLKLAGNLEKDGELWAIIKAPDSMVYRVKEGNHMGQNHGRIIRMVEGKIELTEIMPDGLGGWMERPAYLNLVE